MWSRTQTDNLKVKRVWWLDPEHYASHRKNRKKCSCFCCGNPRKYKEDSPKGLREQALALFHRDEINDFLLN